MELKPLRKAVGSTLVSGIRGRFLTRQGQQALLAAADILSEGVVERSAGEGALYHGSTLVTVELSSGDPASLLKAFGEEGLIEAARRSIGLHVRLMRLARFEAERRIAPLLPRGMSVEVDLCIEGRRLLMDIGVECPLVESSVAVDRAGEER